MDSPDAFTRRIEANKIQRQINFFAKLDAKLSSTCIDPVQYRITEAEREMTKAYIDRQRGRGFWCALAKHGNAMYIILSAEESDLEPGVQKLY